MTRDSYSLHIAREPQRSSAHSELRSIESIYYDVTDPEGWPIAGLLVLLDGRDNPVRAELYLYEGGDTHMDEVAIRQGRLLLQNRYFSDNPEGGSMELRVLQTRQFNEVIQVPLQHGLAVDGAEAGWRSWWPQGWPQSWPTLSPMTALMAAAALFFLVALIIAVPALLRTVRGPDTELAVVNEANVNATQPDAEISDSDAAANQEIVAESVAEQPDANAQAASASTTGLTEQTNGLPPSVNARNDLYVGQSVQIRPTFSLVLRSEPGAEAGDAVGYMEDGNEALIVGGPYWTQGDTDTIVWWFVRMEDGTEAWAAANTSQFTLLEPVQ